MHKITDLNIEQEVLPCFDFTLNKFAKEILHGIFTQPLATKQEIIERQEILKGFLANHTVLKDYTYSRNDLYEARQFLSAVSFNNEPTKTRLRFLISDSERQQTRSKFIQIILLFHKWQHWYFKRMDVRPFPASYKAQFHEINQFLNDFQAERFEKLIREHKFGTRHIIELSKIIAEKQAKDEFTQFWNRLFWFEAFLSISEGIRKHHFVFPEISTDAIHIQELYHPILKKAVKNSIYSDQSANILTGPNMSGKSTFLKAFGLCVYLSHLGIAVPAQKACIPVFGHIAIFIHHRDNLLNGYSHFMNEIMNLKTVVQKAKSEIPCFAVFDELFNGTSMEDALDITNMTIKGLIDLKNSRFFVSTHLHQLKSTLEAENIHPNAFYFECILQDNFPKFTYQIKEGWSDLRIGRLLFDKEQLFSNPGQNH